MKSYVHATIASTFSWAGNIYDLLLMTYVYSYLEEAYHINFFSVSLLFSLGLLGRVVGGTIFGKFADVYGRKPILMLGTGLYALFQGLMAFSPDVLLLFVFRTLAGVFMGAQWTAGTVIAYEQAPNSIKGFVVGIVQAGYGIGYSLTGVTYLAFLPFMGMAWREFLLVGSLPLLLVPYMKFKVSEPGLGTAERVRVSYREYTSLLLKATLAMSGMFIAYFSIFANYVTIATMEGVPSSTLGLIMTIANILLAISFITFGRLADRVDKKKLIYFGLFAMLFFLPFAVPIVGQLRVIPLMLGSIVGYSFSTGFWPLMPLLLADSVPADIRGYLSGLSYNMGGFFGGIANIIIGILVSFFGIATLPKWADIFGISSLLLVLVSILT
ncbi:MFS transporter [Acidianus sp. RZ1]|nr:MFS transporter [Acidianus sp. RZ1]NON62416.1 MFS transporter [Acidianus sp. RZ1]